MKEKRTQKFFVLILSVILVLGGLWYYRPMDIYDLAPDLHPDIISIGISKHEPGAHGKVIGCALGDQWWEMGILQESNQ